MTRAIKTLNDLNRNAKMYLKQIYPDPLIGLKKYADTSTGLGAGLDKNGFPVTGLTEDILEGGKVKVQGTRKQMERLLDLPDGSLKHTNVNYWAKYFIRIGSDPIELDLNDPVDLQKYLFAYAQSIVAIGQKDIKKDSRYEFVLYSEEQEAQQRVANRRDLKTAYRVSDDLDLETKIHILSIYGEIADATAPNSIIDKIDEKIEENPAKFLQIANDPLLLAKSLIKKALDRGVLSLGDEGVMHNQVSIGATENAAAAKVVKDKKLATILKAEISGDFELVKEVLAESKNKK